MSDCDPKYFINRDKEIGLVMNMVSGLAKGKPFAPKERVFHFVGPSGIGKSCLLKQCSHKLTFEQPGCVPILVQMDAMKGGKKGFALELLVALYDAFCTNKNIKSAKYDGQTLVQFARHVQQTITNKGEGFITALFMDEVNVPPKKDMQEIEEYLLLKLLYDNYRTILITAGRSQPAMFNDFALRPSSSNTFQLLPFNEEKTGKQMEALKRGSGVLAGKVVKLGSGVPGNNVKLLKHVSGDPPNITNEVKVIQALVNEIKKKNKIEKRFYPMLEAISILQGFFPEDVVPLFQCHPQLGVGWDEDKVKDIFFELNRIQVGPGGLVDWDRKEKCWAMDESTRDLFEKELQMRDLELWKNLHCSALRMYQKWGQKYNSDMNRNKANYHQQRLRSAGLTCNDLEG